MTRNVRTFLFATTGCALALAPTPFFEGAEADQLISDGLGRVGLPRPVPVLFRHWQTGEVCFFVSEKTITVLVLLFSCSALNRCWTHSWMDFLSCAALNFSLELDSTISAGVSKNSSLKPCKVLELTMWRRTLSWIFEVRWVLVSSSSVGSNMKSTRLSHKEHKIN